MNTKIVAVHLTVPKTQDAIELRARLSERMGWPDRSAAQKRKAASEVEVESRNLAIACQNLERITERVGQLEALTKSLLTRNEVMELADIQARALASLKRENAHLRADLEDLRKQWAEPRH